LLNSPAVHEPVRDLKKLIRSGNWTEAVNLSERLHPSDVAANMQQLSERQQRSLFKLLSTRTASSVLPHLPYFEQFVLLHARSRSDMREIVNEMDVDDRMRLLDELPENAWQQMVDELSAPERELTERLASYPENTAAHHLTPYYISIKPSMRASEALEEVRRKGGAAETVDVVYIVAPSGLLIDDLRLATLVMADPNQVVTSLNDSPLVVVRDTDPLEDVLATFEKYDRLALPVVDKDNHMMGILTVDDVMDVARKFATRDIQKFGGMEAVDAPYFRVRLKEMLRRRGGWLALLFLGEMLTATAMSHFETEIARAVVLALFVPLIISSGGNSGSQATSLLIRSLALRELSVRDWWKVFGRELLLGISLGAFLGAIGFLRIIAWEWLHITSYGPHYLLVAATVWLSLIGVVGFGTLAGSMLPFILRSLGADPATSSAPLVATLVDVTGLVIYFGTARLVLQGVIL